jgi:hypothetical protein
MSPAFLLFVPGVFCAGISWENVDRDKQEDQIDIHGEGGGLSRQTGPGGPGKRLDRISQVH